MNVPGADNRRRPSCAKTAWYGGASICMRGGWQGGGLAVGFTLLYRSCSVFDMARSGDRR